MTDVAGGLITLEYMLEGLSYGDKEDPAPGAQLSARDADVVRYIQAATPVIEHLAGGPILARTETQFRDGGKRAVLLSGRIASKAAVTAVRVDGETVDGYTLDPSSGIVYAGGGQTFTDGFRNVEIDVTVGMSDIPETLQLATRELVRHWIQQGKQAPRAGVLAFGDDAAALVDDPYAVQRRVRQLCAPYAGNGFA